MPITDAVDVTVILSPRALARETFGTSLMLHTLTPTQDALFGVDRLKKLTLQTWPADLGLLGITDGEAAYEDAQAHFTQEFTPATAFIGRQGTTHEVTVCDVLNPFQTYDITVGVAPTDGSYDVAVPGEASTPFSFVASTSTTQDVVDGLIAAFVSAGDIVSFTWADSGGGVIAITAIAAGVDIALTAVGPTGPDLGQAITQVHTVPDGAYTITIPGEADSPFTFTGSTSTAAEVVNGLLDELGMASSVASLPTGDLPTLKYLDSSSGDITSIDIVDLEFLGTLSVTVTANMTATASQVRVVRQAQETLITVIDVGGGLVSDGTYTLTLTTTTGQKQYSFIASGSTLNAVVADFKTQVDLDPSDLVKVPLATPVDGVLFLEAANAGVLFSAAITSPLSDAISELRLINRSIVDDVIAAEDGSWYMLLPGSHAAVDFVPLADYVETRTMECIVQSSDADIATSVDTDVFSLMQANLYKRTWGVWHNIDSEGVHAGWAGRVLVFPVGQTQFPRKELINLTGIQFSPTVQDPINIKGKTGSYLENFAALGPGRAQMMGSGLVFGGRVADVMRAVDTLGSNISTALIELFITNEIVPYTTKGVAKGRAAILIEQARAEVQGYLVPGTFVLTDPDLTTATGTEREQGVFPPYTFVGTIQVGTTKIIVNGEVAQ